MRMEDFCWTLHLKSRRGDGFSDEKQCTLERVGRWRGGGVRNKIFEKFDSVFHFQDLVRKASEMVARDGN